MVERTFIMLKPDAVQRGVCGEIIHRFERVGLKIVGMKFLVSPSEVAKEHYGEDIEKRRGKAVRDLLLSLLKEGPVLAMVLEGVEAVANVRKMVGDTFPDRAIPGTIRGDFSHVSVGYADRKKKAIYNLIHASSDKADAKREVALWFSNDELFEYQRHGEHHLQ